MRGPCAKQRVVCTIETYGGNYVRGENDCANPQAVCPRLPGEDYAKCKTVCQQDGHAELQAVKAFKAAAFRIQVGTTATIVGHTYACRECQEALYGAGVRWISILPGKPA